MPQLKTPRLLLRSFCGEDLDALAKLCANERFMRFSGTGPIDRARTTALLEDRIMPRTRAGLPALFAIVIPDEQQLIGYCGFLPQTVEQVEELEIGYRLHPDYWRRGLATEAARAVRDHGFADLQLPRLISLIVPENHLSQRVAEKNGMRIEKRTIFRGLETDVWAISRERWLAMRR